MTKFNRRRFNHLLGAAAATTLLGSAAHAAPRTVTVASLFGEDKPETKIWLRIRDQVEKKLPGRFDFRIVQNAALGGEKQVAEGIRLGSIQASLSTISAVSSWVPDSQILDLPFLFKDRSHVRRTLDGKLGQEFKDKFAAQGFTVLGFINYGARHLLAKEAIPAPAGINGKRIRVIQSPLHTELWKAYGARPTAIPITETYNALKTGVVDAMDLTKSAYAGFKLHEVVPYLIETSHIWATGIVYVSQTFWKSLSDEERSVFAAAGLEGARAFDDLIIADEAASVATVSAAGGKVIPAQNLAGWQEGARKVWAQLAPTLGGLERIETIARS
ncbi:solute-binding protein [Rhodoferax lithotrophicus]|uniref:Solute-binding protein n=1 Tax=Rhodoferax lithotrophicus TaxID=2798804 RepID=A0ABM7MRF1_9BURK|nr:TRAP transporter substrate-binding protein [Rhodoferax sp. MIZ03]BCO28936.1 solute-binding protein [Rhodoferax sp. MIZ03]